MSKRPIADYAMISDCQSAALIGTDGSIDWWCAPRFDSPSIFGRLLGENAGHFSIRPACEFTVTRRYHTGSMVLETCFTTERGTALLTDALALGENETGHAVGRHSPHVLLRTVRCSEGSVPFVLELAARPEYGEVLPAITATPGGVLFRGGTERLRFSSSVPLQMGDHEVSAQFLCRAGDYATFALARGSAGSEHSCTFTTGETIDGVNGTILAWQSWSKLHQSYAGPYRDEVAQSGRVLLALTYQPTGAMVAAPTTSLPEQIGGALNWDYRYTWVRDASMTMSALWIAACPDEAARYFTWLAESSASRVNSDYLQIMFGVGGEHALYERELTHLSGWRGSAPVRVGNGAWNQRQNDVYGAILGAALCFRDSIDEFDELTHRFIVEAVERAATVWESRDQGIWEIRGEPQRFTHSLLMCWVAVSNGVELCEQLGSGDRRERWKRVSENIAKTIREHAWSEKRGAYAQSLGSDTLDASVLTLIISGFLPATDARARATVEAIEADLLDERGLLRRYLSDESPEGAFLLCSFWLAEAWAIIGEPNRARVIVDRVLGYANDVGLLAEEVNTNTGELIGNFPQAFSHIGLINAAWQIDSAEKRQSTSTLSKEPL